MSDTTDRPNGVGNVAEPFVPTHQVATTTTLEGPPAVETLYPPGGSDPSGTKPEAVAEMQRGPGSLAATGTGIEGEEVVWEARYSMKNFLGRTVLRMALTVAWLVLAFYTWADGHRDLGIVTGVLGAVLLILWLMLGLRIVQARFGHHQLTNRRLFVASGLARRRRDQLELLRVKDVFTRQTLWQRLMSLGTVVVVSHEKELPTFYLTGVDDPKEVMDLIWHHARSERDNRSTKIDAV